MTGTISPVLPSATELGEIVEQVWTSFLSGEITVEERDAGRAGHAGELVASVSIGGQWCGHLMVIAGLECSRQIAADMFETEPGDVTTAEVADALGEIANMIGGSVKGMVGVPAVLSLPQVVLDAEALVSPEARRVVAVRARWGRWPLEISLWERSPHAGSVMTEGW